MAKKQRGHLPAATQRGVFTRRRSEIFLRRTRSGLLRADLSDGCRRRNTISATSAYSSVESRCASMGIKDLRLRRVFSPANIAVESSPYQKVEGKSCEDRMDAAGELMEEKIREESDGVEVDEGLLGSVSGSGYAMEYCHFVHTSGTPMDEDNMDRAKMLGLWTEQPAVPAAESTCPARGVGLGEMPSESDESKDEQLQCTPTDCLDTAGMEEDITVRATMMDLCNERAASMMPMATEVSFPPKIRLGVKSCPSSRLFRNPSSFSYRRLLPFFMDLVKDNSNDVQIIPCQISPQKLKTPSEEMATLSNSLGGKELPPQGCIEEELRETLNDDVSEMEESSSKVIEYSTSRSPSKCSNDEIHGDTMLLSELNSAGELDLVEVKSDPSDEDLNLAPDLLFKSSQSASTVSEALSVEELADNVNGISCLPIGDKRPGSTVIHGLEIEKPLFRTATRSPKKGILKKKTRGCKGICMCLDCISFRIHADRAFEFSRKQMLEANETIEGLMKELASLRNLVEKSTQPMIEGSSSYTIFHLNQVLLNGACRSSRVEEVANKRRREMFNDLNAHCRIQGPRVTFAESIDKAYN